jgi:hypothetical protein
MSKPSATRPNNPATTPAEDPKELRRIGLAKRGIAAAEDELRYAVRDARAAGYSWSAIGRTLGVTKKAAQERFGEPANIRGRRPSGSRRSSPLTHQLS